MSARHEGAPAVVAELRAWRRRARSSFVVTAPPSPVVTILRGWKLRQPATPSAAARAAAVARTERAGGVLEQRQVGQLVQRQRPAEEVHAEQRPSCAGRPRSSPGRCSSSRDRRRRAPAAARRARRRSRSPGRCRPARAPRRRARGRARARARWSAAVPEVTASACVDLARLRRSPPRTRRPSGPS